MMRTFVHRWIAATVIGSVICAIDKDWAMQWLALAPDKVLHGELWRLITWGLVVTAPFTLLIVCYLIYKFGGDLAAVYGESKVRGLAVQLVILAGVATVAVAVVLGKREPHVCTSLTLLPLLVVWARAFPDRQLLFMGVLPRQGMQIVVYATVIVGVFTVFSGVYALAPELAACGLAMVYPLGWLR